MLDEPKHVHMHTITHKSCEISPVGDIIIKGCYCPPLPANDIQPRGFYHTGAGLLACPAHLNELHFSCHSLSHISREVKLPVV